MKKRPANPTLPEAAAALVKAASAAVAGIVDEAAAAELREAIAQAAAALRRHKKASKRSRDTREAAGFQGGRPREIDQAKAAELRGQGMSLRAIAEALDCSPEAVRRALLRGE